MKSTEHSNYLRRINSAADYSSIVNPAIFIILLLIDQLTKYLCAKNLPLHESKVIVPNFFEFTHIQNSGAAFGILQGQRVFFIALSLVIFAFMFVFYRRLRYAGRYRRVKTCIVVVAAGAAGNFIDRVRHGYVVDFVNVKLFDFPVFNLADCFITIGACVLCYLLIFVVKD